MAPLMFTFNRSTQTLQQHSLSVKSIEEVKILDCHKSYLLYSHFWRAERDN